MSDLTYIPISKGAEFFLENPSQCTEQQCLFSRKVSRKQMGWYKLKANVGILETT